MTTSSEAGLDRVALQGAAWSGVAKWTTQILSWLATFAIARILSPQDYGIITMASVYLGFVTLFSEFGIGATIIIQRELPDHQLRQLNSVALLLGCGAFLLSLLAAWPLGRFYHSAQVPLVVVVMSTTFILNSLQVVPANTLRRELRFRTLALIDLVRGILVPLTTLGLALLGLAYWALAGGVVVSALASAAMTLAQRRVGFERPTRKDIGDKIRVSSDILVARLGWFVYSSADFVVAGRRLGEAPLGDYTLAWTIANAPIEKIFAILTDVTPALFAAVQDQREALRRYFLNMTELLAFVCFPVAAGLSLVATDLVPVVLGSKWDGAALPLVLLAAYATVRALTPLYGYLLVAVGETRFSMWTSLATAVAMPAGFLVGSRWGAAGIAAAWIVVHPVLTLVVFARVRTILDLRARAYLRALRLGLDGTLVMVAVVLAVRWWLPGEPSVLRLSATVVGGASVFIAVTLALHRVRLRAIAAWLRRVRSGTVPTAAPAS